MGATIPREFTTDSRADTSTDRCQSRGGLVRTLDTCHRDLDSAARAGESLIDALHRVLTAVQDSNHVLVVPGDMDTTRLKTLLLDKVMTI